MPTSQLFLFLLVCLSALTQANFLPRSRPSHYLGKLTHQGERWSDIFKENRQKNVQLRYQIAFELRSVLNSILTEMRQSKTATSLSILNMQKAADSVGADVEFIVKSNQPTSRSRLDSNAFLEQFFKRTKPHWHNFRMRPVAATSYAALKSLTPLQQSLWAEVSKTYADSIDPSVNPCDDFYQFACGNWLKNHPLSEGQTRAVSFSAVQQRVDREVLTAIKRIDVSGWSRSDTGATVTNDLALQVNDEQTPRAIRQVRTAFDICLNDKGSTNAGVLKDLVAGVGGWPMAGFDQVAEKFVKPEILQARLSAQHAVGSLFDATVDTDWLFPRKGAHMLFLAQGVYYYPTSYYQVAPVWAEKEQAYKEKIAAATNSFAKAISGRDLNEEALLKDVELIVNFEKTLASFNTPDADRRNFSREYNLFNVRTAAARWPNFDWETYVQQLLTGYATPKRYSNIEFSVKELEFTNKLNKLLGETPARTVQNYLVWRLLAKYEEFLPKADSSEKSAATTVGREHDCQTDMRRSLKLPVGRLYIDEYFNKQTPNARQPVAELIENVLSGVTDMLAGVDWMDEKSLKGAYAKAGNVVQNIAYPDWIMDDASLDKRHPLTALDIKPDDSYLQVQLKLAKFAAWFTYSTLDKPRNRRKFDMGGPALVNAWYQPTENSITAPAAIINQPFFHPGNPAAVNYGALGSVMGHEMVHGFDDSGVQWDDDGVMRDWLDASSFEGFQKMADCVIEEYDGLCPRNSTPKCVNGKMTQGENIGDNGGTPAAYRAFQNLKATNGDEPPLLGEMARFSSDQLFFISYAQIYCQNMVDSQLRHLMLTDPHTPDQLRVFGALTNFPAFAQAYSCPVGSRMAPENHCTVWA